MNRPATPHATHDELLLARLFGGDVDERERSRATAQIAACGECAAFLADLGAIAAATKTLPVPARPRDFTLTEADAARLRRPRAARGMLGMIARSRALGTSMAAVGLVGMIVVGALSAVGPMTSASATGGNSVFAGAVPSMAAVAAPTAAPAGPELTLTDQQAGTSATPVAQPPTEPPRVAASPVPAASPAPASPVPSAAGSSAELASALPPNHASVSPAGSSGTGSLAMASPWLSASAGSAYGDNGKSAATQGSVAPERFGAGGSSGSGGPDGRALALIGFAALLVGGLLLLAVPRVSMRRGRPSH